MSGAAARTGSLKKKGGRNTEKWKAGGSSGTRMKIIADRGRYNVIYRDQKGK